MNLIEILHTLGMATLYIGFASSMGFIARRGWLDRNQRWERALVVAYGLLIFLPTSILIRYYEAWSLGLRITVILSGILSLTITFLRPGWLPTRLWSRTVSRRYSALSMGIIFAWCILAWRTQMSSAVLLLGLAACLAGLSSLKSSLQNA
ncbi:MAG: hypothetical protein KAR65_09600 [Anaerolineales bacterium]|nr:hypothetical protein [Anaerolineales bacterium]